MANGTMSSMDRYLGAVERSAERKRQALNYERQRRDAQERSQIENINALSGFNAAALRSPKYKAIFEDRIADAKNYINGMGSYEGQEYSALEAANKINSLNSLYKKMSAHYGGDVAEAIEGNKNSAFSVADDRVRINEPGDGSGVAVYENNSPMAYDEAMDRHNNYFEWNGEFDANGNPLGYMIGDDGQPTGDPMSIFDMQAYANPATFRPPTIEEPIPRLLDVTADQSVNERFNRLARASKDEFLQMGMNDPKDQHDYVVKKLFDQYMGKDRESIEFRESVVEEINGMTNSYKPEILKSYIEGNFDAIPEEDLNSINSDAIEAWSSYTYEMPDAPESLHSGVNMHSDDAGFTYQLDAYKEPIEIPAGRSMYSPSNAEDNGYKITAVGINNDGEIVADISYLNSRELAKVGEFDEPEFVDVPTSQTVVIGDPTALGAPSGGAMGMLVPGLDDANERAFAQEVFYNLPKSEQDRLLKARFETLKQRLGEPTIVQGDEVVATGEVADVPEAKPQAERSTEAVLQDDPVVRSLVESDQLDLSDESVVADTDVDGTPLVPLTEIEPNMLNRISDAQQAAKDGDMPVGAAQAVISAIRNPNTTEDAMNSALGTLDSAIQEGNEKRRGLEKKDLARKELSALQSIIRDPSIIDAAKQGNPKAIDGIKDIFENSGLTLDQGLRALEGKNIDLPKELFEGEATEDIPVANPILDPELQAFANLAEAMEDKPTQEVLEELRSLPVPDLTTSASLDKQIRTPDGRFLQIGSEAGQPVFGPETRINDEEVSGVRSSEVQQRMDDARDPQGLVNQEFVDEARNQAAQKVQAEGMPTTPEDLDKIVEEAVTAAQAPQGVQPIASRAAKALSGLTDSFKRFITGQPSAGPAVTPPATAPAQPEAVADPAKAPVPTDVAIERERLRRIEETERLKGIEQELLAKKAAREQVPAVKEEGQIDEDALVGPLPEMTGRRPIVNKSDLTVAKGYNAPREQLAPAFDAAVAAARSAGHPFPEAMASQYALESNWGSSKLSKEHNNYFGLKTGPKTERALRDAGVEFGVVNMDTAEYIDGKKVTVKGEPFLSFPDAENGFKGYMVWIEQNMPRALQATDGVNYLEILKELNYATDPDYVKHNLGRAKAAGREIK